MTPSASLKESRERELWRALGGVDDPELDESVVSMGFVEAADVADGGDVAVDFRLPTYWCSPNFAFLMLDDIRRALEGLSWSPRFMIRLHDHMFADEVNAGLAAGRSFPAIFGDLAGGEDLDALRETFRRKAYERRQEAVLRSLREAGLDDEAIAALTIGDLEAGDGPADADAVRRYLEACRARWGSPAAGEPAFRTLTGEVVAAAALGEHLSRLRRLRVTMEFNGALCRGLKEARYKRLEVVDGEPTLVDFMLDRVPPPNAGAGARVGAGEAAGGGCRAG